MLIEFTTYDSIRALLGLNTKELPDSLLSSEIYSLILDDEHYKVSATLISDYTAAKLSATDAAKRLVRSVRIFSSHAVAYKATEALPMFSTKAITDGKAGIYRDGNSPYTATMLNIEEAYYRAKSTLQEAYALYLGSSAAIDTPPTLMGVSVPTSDPVVGS